MKNPVPATDYERTHVLRNKDEEKLDGTEEKTICFSIKTNKTILTVSSDFVLAPGHGSNRLNEFVCDRRRRLLQNILFRINSERIYIRCIGVHVCACVLW